MKERMCTLLLQTEFIDAEPEVLALKLLFVIFIISSMFLSLREETDCIKWTFSHHGMANPRDTDAEGGPRFGESCEIMFQLGDGGSKQ
jgi:hypothetical protein